MNARKPTLTILTAGMFLAISAPGLRAAPVLRAVPVSVLAPLAVPVSVPSLPPMIFPGTLPDAPLSFPATERLPALLPELRLPAKTALSAAPEPLGILRTEPERRPAAQAKALFNGLKTVERELASIPQASPASAGVRLSAAFDDMRFLRNGADAVAADAPSKLFR